LPVSAVPLVWFAWTSEATVDRRTVLVGPSSSPFVPGFNWDSASRYFDRRVEREVASNDAFSLPCPWAPLQSMTAAASRRFPCLAVSKVLCAGQKHRRSGWACCASGSGSATRGCWFQGLWLGDERARHAAGVGRIVRGGCQSRLSDGPRSEVQLSPRPKAWRRAKGFASNCETSSPR
jgi:hypothetical protein